MSASSTFPVLTGLESVRAWQEDFYRDLHACGHDVHVTCLLGAMELLARSTGEWSGNIVAVFQPAEEVADGARSMLEDGLSELVGTVDVAM